MDIAKIEAFAMLTISVSFACAAGGIVAMILTHEPPCKKVEADVSRPMVCQEYYNDGTDRWKDCMGVGLK